MLHLILFGPPGSGKGTQAALLTEKYGLTHISTGDLFRYEISHQTPLGLEASAFMSRGELVPDRITIGMLRNKVENTPDAKGFIFDGFPRTVAQAEALDAFLAERNESIRQLISLVVDEDEVVKRLLLRGQTSGRADDTNEEIIRKRMSVYRQETSPVFDYYAAKGHAREVYGMGGIDEIFRRLCDAVEA